MLCERDSLCFLNFGRTTPLSLTAVVNVQLKWSQESSVSNGGCRCHAEISTEATPSVWMELKSVAVQSSVHLSLSGEKCGELLQMCISRDQGSTSIA